MIKLDEVAVEELGARFYSKDVQDLIELKGIITSEDLVNEMNENNDPAFLDVKKRLAKVINSINYSNQKGKEPNISYPIPYLMWGLDYNDKMNNGDVLLLSNPTTEYSVRHINLYNMPINKIKRYLSLSSTDGTNYLIKKVRNIGESSLSRVADAIDRYTIQIMFQAKQTDRRDINLFNYDKYYKRQLTEQLYADIIAYIVEEADELIWGKLTPQQKEKLVSSIVNDKEIDLIIRRRMINIISNYSTASELHEIPHGNYKVLDQFIKTHITY